MNINYIGAFLLVMLMGCGNDFLELRREANQVIPKELKDYDALISNRLMSTQSSHVLGSVGGDEFEVSAQVWNSFPLGYIVEKNAYVWADDVYEAREVDDWNKAYQRILYANITLDATHLTIKASDELVYRRVIGQAYFHRAWNFFQLAQEFCESYGTDALLNPGIPLRTSYDLEQTFKRSTLQETYAQIIDDLENATELLPVKQESPFLPNRPAAYGLLARVYLTMGNFERAYHYSSLSLGDNDFLIDLNDINFVFLNEGSSPFSSMLYGIGNKSVLFMSIFSPVIASATRFNADRELYSEFKDGDLRRSLFFHQFNGRILYVGSYYGQGHSNFFSGLSTEEQYLINAESAVRLENIDVSLRMINRLLEHRYSRDAYSEITERDNQKLLKVILMERRKELYMRGIRWEDIKRLNKEGIVETTITRMLDDRSFVLAPDNNKWIWPIPENEVVRNGVEQNQR